MPTSSFTGRDILQIAVYIGTLVAFTPLLGSYMTNVFMGKKHFLTPALGRLERILYGICGIEHDSGMSWKSYTSAILIFNFLGFAILIIIQMMQHVLPLNPQTLKGVSWHLAFNTAMSFVTNTNWQSYAGETTLSYLVQMLGLTVQNFVSAATGIAVLLVIVRGLMNKESWNIGNFWIDLVRTTLYILLPLSVLWSIILMGQGVVQNFSPDTPAATIEGSPQMLPMGPVASQVAIKQLGTNGGGYFNTNSAHPFENPTPLSNFFEMLAILLIPSAIVYSYGQMVGQKRQGFALWGSMMFLFIAGLTIALYTEYQDNSLMPSAAGMEGKETRFGVTNSVTWEVATTDASNGSVNSMHDSFVPMSGMVALINILLGEVIFGGVGAGMYGILHFVFLTVFIAGLMVGRTPEYLGKKIESFEVKMTMLAVIAPSMCILVFTAIASVLPEGVTSLNNAGPHGFSEILYAFSSAAGNNGSAFAGLNTNTPFYNVTLAVAMFIGRFGVIVPMLAIAGSLSAKKVIPHSVGTFQTDTLLFGVLLVGVILIVGGLTFFPALTLGPIVEQFLMNARHAF